MTELAIRRVAGIGGGVRTKLWIVRWWVAGRVLVFATAAAMHAVGPRGLIGHDERGSVVGVLGAWDGRWYRTVAENGYLLEPGRQSDPAFFPFYPMLLRMLNALGIGYGGAGILLSSVAFLAALIAFERLTCELLGAAVARRTTVYVALFPLGYVFSMSYPESMVLLLMSLAALAARRGLWLWTAALLAMGALARPEMLLLALPLLPLALRERRGRHRGLALGAVFAPLAALGSFALYLGLRLGDPLAWMDAERAWGRQFTALGLLRAIENVPDSVGDNAWTIRDVVLFAVYLALLGVARKGGVPRLWLLASTLIVVLPTFSGSFQSVGRFGLLAPAMYWALAIISERVVVDLALRSVAAALLVGGVVSLAYVFP